MNESNSVEAQLFDTANLSAREQVTTWVKLKEKIGTRSAGNFLGYWEKPAEGVFRRQVCVALRDFKDPSIVYGVTLPEYFENDIKQYRLNDRVGYEYYKDNPSKEPGISATKVIRGFNLDLKKRMEDGTASTAVIASGSTGEKEPTHMDSEDDPFA